MTKEKHYDVAVVGGAGHVGLPLALSFADQGLNVLVNDINQAAMDSIAEGTVPFFEEGAEEMLARVLKAGTISFSADVSKIAAASTVIVTIGTPVDEFLNPSHRVIVDCFTNLLQGIHRTPYTAVSCDRAARGPPPGNHGGDGAWRVVDVEVVPARPGAFHMYHRPQSEANK